MKRTKYKRLYKKALEDIDILRSLLEAKTEQYKMANRQADNLAKELLNRLAN